MDKPSNWFERLTGVRESSPEAVRQQIEVQGDRMISRANGKSWTHGTLETPTLAELRERVRAIGPRSGTIKVQQKVANVQDLHRDPEYANALFQVASQFNLLEMMNPRVTPEQGIGRYESDPTQGPACAIAAGAGTIFRNYFADVDGQIGQTCDRQIDCLRDLALALENDQHQHWTMQNGYALPTARGLEQIDQRLRTAAEHERDELRGLVRIGLHWQTQVTLGDCTHRVSQAYCSAMPVNYARLDPEAWEGFACLILEAAYEATLCAAILNASESGVSKVFLTRLGGGAFGNHTAWIADAMTRAIDVYAGYDLEVVMVSYGSPQSDMASLIQRYPN